MEDLFKKLVYTGIGFASLAYKKMDEVVDDLKEKGKISHEESEDILGKFRKETEKTREDLEKDLKDILQAVLHKMDIPTRKDLHALEKRIAALESSSKHKSEDK